MMEGHYIPSRLQYLGFYLYNKHLFASDYPYITLKVKTVATAFNNDFAQNYSIDHFYHLLKNI